MSTIPLNDDNRKDADFNLVVESSTRSDAIFPAPPGWTSEVHSFSPLTFRAHIHSQQHFTISHNDSEPVPPSILTIPDIGQGENTFCAFFEFCRRSKHCPQLDIAPAHYHTCMPGHELDAPNLSPSDNISMDAIVSAVLALIEKRNIPRIAGFGIGYGATVLLHAAAKAPQKFSALFLISPVISASYWQEWLTQTTDSLVSRQLGIGLSRRTKDRLLARWLSHMMNEDSSGPAVALEEDLDRRNATNVLRLLSEDTSRQSATPILKNIKSRALLVTGKESSLKFHVDDNMNEFNLENVSRLDLPNVGSLVHDEEPERVARALSLFLQGIPGFS